MRVFKLILALGLLALAAAIGFAYHSYEKLRVPFKGYSEEEIFFTVERGASGQAVGRALEAKGIIENAWLFSVALRVRDQTDRIQAGEYRFFEPRTALQVIDQLVEGDIYTFAVTVPEGLTVRETAEHLSSQALGDAAELERVFRDPSGILELDPEAEDLEGYLFPSTYRFSRNPTPAEVRGAMLHQFKQTFTEGRRARSQEVGLTLREVVTLASVIEKETGQASERPLIGSVFWNRLERGMSLGSDPTIIFALKRMGTYDGNLRRKDLELDSPYNTYIYPGLPPGPIASPGAESIDAVLYPEESPYYYFVSKNDGSHYFSKTLREHNNAVRKYQVEYFRKRRRQREADPS